MFRLRRGYQLIRVLPPDVKVQVSPSIVPELEFSQSALRASAFPLDPDVDRRLPTVVWVDPRPFVVSARALWPKEGEGEPLEFKHPVDIETSEADGVVRWRLREFDIVAEGSDDEQAEAALLDQLVLLRDTYASESDANLTVGAQELKRQLLETLG